MRTTLALWLVTAALGILIYAAWYRGASAQPADDVGAPVTTPEAAEPLVTEAASAEPEAAQTPDVQAEPIATEDISPQPAATDDVGS